MTTHKIMCPRCKKEVDPEKQWTVCPHPPRAQALESRGGELIMDKIKRYLFEFPEIHGLPSRGDLVYVGDITPLIQRLDEMLAQARCPNFFWHNPRPGPDPALRTPTCNWCDARARLLVDIKEAGFK